MTRAQASPRKPKPPGSDEEILDHAHDRLCLWLRRNLAQCVEYLWNPPTAWTDKTAAAAAHDARDELRDALRVLQRWSTDGDTTARGQEAFAQKGKDLQAILADFRPPELERGRVRAKVESWEAQFEIRVATAKRDQTKLVGFIDLVADVWQPTKIVLDHFATSEGPDSGWSFALRHHMRRSQGHPERVVAKLHPEKLDWRVMGKRFTAAFDVRLNLKTLQDTQRQLRTLRSEAGIGTVVLVTEVIDSEWIPELEHEGFRVIVPTVVVETGSPRGVSVDFALARPFFDRCRAEIIRERWCRECRYEFLSLRNHRVRWGGESVTLRTCRYKRSCLLKPTFPPFPPFQRS